MADVRIVVVASERVERGVELGGVLGTQVPWLIDDKSPRPRTVGVSDPHCRVRDGRDEVVTCPAWRHTYSYGSDTDLRSA